MYMRENVGQPHEELKHNQKEWNHEKHLKERDEGIPSAETRL